MLYIWHDIDLTLRCDAHLNVMMISNNYLLACTIFFLQ